MSGSSISFGYVGETPIFMDLGGDLYFSLEPADAQALIRHAGPPAEAPPVAASILDDQKQQRPISLADFLSVTVQVGRTRRALRRRPIGGLVTQQAAGMRGPVHDDADDGVIARTLARRFARARKLVPVAPHCLLDSLSLIAWLGRRGVASLLVFGVKLDPFAAHCWVQRGALLLTDRREEVERFSPVRVIACIPASP